MLRMSVRWLREWLDSELPAEELARRLTMAGVETELVGPAARPFEGVVVARVERVAGLPGSAGKGNERGDEKGDGKVAGTASGATPGDGGGGLYCCELACGPLDDPVQVVSGAPGLRPGLRVAFAPPGARLPNGARVEAREVAGRRSAGLICSAAALELDSGEESEELLVLPEDAELGASLWDCLELADELLEVTPTPNRGDCLSVLGTARELAAVLGVSLRRPPPVRLEASATERQAVQLEDPQGCPRYAGRLLLDLDPKARSPAWLRERLRRSGMRALHPVVDVSNYVMLELGQPLHAFDRARLQGAIRVRRAAQGEELCLLDGKLLPLRPEHLVIADERNVLALAGVMGGRDSAVSAATRDVFLESAWFHPERIAFSARSPALRTAAAQRFERGVDPGLQEQALERATELLGTLCGARPGPLLLQEAREQLPRRTPVRLRRKRLDSLLGWSPPTEEVEKALQRQELRLERTAGGWKATPPGHRFDLGLEVDLVEEVARLTGYEHIPTAAPRTARVRPVLPHPLLKTANRMARRLCERGYHEALSYAFVDPDQQGALFPLESKASPLPLANPLSRQLSVLRFSTWSGLLTALRHNLHRQQERVRLFEYGVVFQPGEKRRPREEYRLGGVACGAAHDEQWGESARPLDFYDLKGDLECLLDGMGAVRFQAIPYTPLRDGQAARLELVGENGRKEHLGYLGCLHPALVDTLKVPASTWLFEVRLQPLLGERPVQAPVPSRFPGLRRDLALVVDETVEAADLLGCIRSAAAGRNLVDVLLFDVYRSPELEKNLKSLAIGLIFQKNSGTLGPEELEEALSRILGAVQKDFGAVLREG